MNARPKRDGGTKERRKRDAGSSREAILVAAEAIFAERGYDGAGLADIAALAGLARATPTYFFGSKRALYEAVLARATSAREHALHEAFEPVRSWAEERGGRAELRGALLQAIGQYLAFLDANPSFARLIGWEAQSGAQGLAGGGVHAAAVTEAIGALHAVRHERGLADFEPALVSVALVSMCFLPVAHRATFRAGGGIDTSAPAFRRAYAEVVADAIMGLQLDGRLVSLVTMTTPHPLIAVSTGFTDYGDYLGVVYSRPLARHGAIPMILPYAGGATERETLLARVDGVILGVGRDIEPQRYGGARHLSLTSHSPLRDAAEIALVRDALAAGVPVLGICRGMQMINVALGGTLHVDHSVLPAPARDHPGGDWDRWERVVDATVHGTPPPAHPSHPIEIADGSLLSEALGRRAVVNSYHHQSIAAVGDGLRVTARAPDGVIESIEVPDAAFCLGVQWELQEECAPGGNGDRILRLFLHHAARSHAASIPSAA